MQGTDFRYADGVISFKQPLQEWPDRAINAITQNGITQRTATLFAEKVLCRSFGSAKARA